MDSELLNKQLTDAMVGFANHPSMESERKVYLAFKNALFIMPVIADGDFEILDGRFIDLKPGTKIQIAQFNNEGHMLYPAFTDLNEVAKWNDHLEADNIYLVKMHFEDYEEMLKDNDEVYGFVINPYHQDLIIGDMQFKRYHEILFEEEHKDAYTAPITSLLDELRANYSVELEDRVYHMFQNLRLLMPVQVPNASCVSNVTEDGVAEIVENTPINVMPLENESGEQVFPVFTDLYEAKCSGIDANPKENRYLIEINFDGLEALVAMNEHVRGFSINPFNHNIIIGPEQMAKYHQLKGEFTSVVDHGRLVEDDKLADTLSTTAEEEAKVLSEFASTPYQVDPEVDNEKLKKALTKELSSYDSINKAYLVRKIYADHDNYLLVIDKERDGKNVIADLRQAAKPALEENRDIEFLSHNEDEAKQITEKVEPFYEKAKKRKFLGLF